MLMHTEKRKKGLADGKRRGKRQMYLMSTEKALRLGESKALKSSMSSIAGTASQCQKCFQTRHWAYECKNELVYMSQPSRTQQLKNPKLKMKVSISYDLDIPDVKDETAEKTSKKCKRKRRLNSDSGSDGEASVFETDSGSSSVTGSDYSSPESSLGTVHHLIQRKRGDCGGIRRSRGRDGVGGRARRLSLPIQVQSQNLILMIGTAGRRAGGITEGAKGTKTEKGHAIVTFI